MGKLFGLLIITILLSPVVLLLELVLFLLLIAALIPLPAVHNIIMPINAKISSILGDSFIYDSSTIRPGVKTDSGTHNSEINDGNRTCQYHAKAENFSRYQITSDKRPSGSAVVECGRIFVWSDQRFVSGCVNRNQSSSMLGSKN
jgi:hypothetical protein